MRRVCPYLSRNEMFIYIRCQQLDNNSKESGPKGPGFEPTPERASRVFPWWEVCWSNGALQNIKFQAPNYKQIPNSNTQWPKQVWDFEFRSLWFVWYLWFVIWNFWYCNSPVLQNSSHLYWQSHWTLTWPQGPGFPCWIKFKAPTTLLSDRGFFFLIGLRGYSCSQLFTAHL